MRFRRVTSLFIIALLLCGTNVTAAIAGCEPPIRGISNDSEDTYISKGINAGISGDAGVSSDSTTAGSLSMLVGNRYDPLPAGLNCTGSAICFTIPDILSNVFEMDSGDMDFTQLHRDLDSVSIYGILEKEGAYYSLYMPIEWDFSTVDAETPGVYTVPGNILLPSGAALVDGLESTIHIAVQVKSPPDIPSDPTEIVLTAFDEQYRMDAVAFELGTSPEELSEWFPCYCDGFTGYDSQGNAYYLMTASWSLDDVNTGTAGVYYASAPPDLEEDYVLGDGVPLPRLLCVVSIQAPDKPDINCCVSARGFMLFPWVLSTELQDQLDQFTVRVRQNDGLWEQMDENFYTVISDGLYLYQSTLERGNTYKLQVSYPGGQTGILTFEYDGSLTIIDYSGGDRDGGDVGGGSPSTGSQPAPVPVQTPGSSDDDGDDDDDYGDVDNSDNDGGADDAEHTQDTLTAPYSNEGQTSALYEAPQEPSPILPEIKALEPIELIQVTYPISAETPPPAQIEAVSELYHASTEILPEPVSMSPVIRTEQPVRAPQKDPASSEPEPKPDASISSFQTQEATQKQDIVNIPQEAVSNVWESYSPTKTVISGLRLHDLCIDEKNVVFGASCLTVIIPSQLLLSLGLADTDTLTVDLTQPEQGKVKLAVDVSGRTVTKLPETMLKLRYVPHSEPSNITIWNEAGTKAAEAEFDGEFLRFTVDMTGTYTITETDDIQESKSNRSPILPLIPLVGTGLLLSVGGTAFIRGKLYG